MRPLLSEPLKGVGGALDGGDAKPNADDDHREDEALDDLNFEWDRSGGGGDLVRLFGRDGASQRDVPQ